MNATKDLRCWIESAREADPDLSEADLQELEAIADGIDISFRDLYDEQLDSAMTAAWESIASTDGDEAASHGFLPLPHDMDGKPIRLGDAIVTDGEAYGNARYGHVTGIEYREDRVSLSIAPIGRGYDPACIHHGSAPEDVRAGHGDEDGGAGCGFVPVGCGDGKPWTEKRAVMAKLEKEGKAPAPAAIDEHTGDYDDLADSLAGTVVNLRESADDTVVNMRESADDTVKDPKSALSSEAPDIPGHETREIPEEILERWRDTDTLCDGFESIRDADLLCHGLFRLPRDEEGQPARIGDSAWYQTTTGEWHHQRIVGYVRNGHGKFTVRLQDGREPNVFFLTPPDPASRLETIADKLEASHLVGADYESKADFVDAIRDVAEQLRGEER